MRICPFVFVAVLFALGIAVDATAQRNPDLDLSQVARPTAPEPKREAQDGIIEGESGVVRGGISNAQPQPSLSLAIRLLGVEPQACSWGQPLTYDVELRNVGDRPFALPWSVRPERLGAGDGGGVFRVAKLSLTFVGSATSAVTTNGLFGSVESLYSSLDDPETVRVLTPGQAVTIRATSNCSTIDRQLAGALKKGDTMQLAVRADVQLSSDPSTLSIVVRSVNTTALAVSRP